MSEKILSIAVPSYNVQDYLEKGLESYADERLKEGLEVLIVDDGSVDATAEIAQRYVERYPEIFRLIRKENGGHGSAVNAGIDHASGRYFRIVDGDDWVNTEHLVTLLQRLDGLDVDMVVDEKREVNMTTGKTEHFPIPDYVQTDKVLSFDEICTREDIGSFIMIHTLTMKTEILKKADIHLLEHVFYVDYEYIVKATCLGKDILFLNLEIYQYLVGNVNQSVSSQNYVKRYLHHDKVIKEMLRFAVRSSCSGARREYLDRKVDLIIHSHYKIALIFNQDRKEGVRQAKQFRTYLRHHYSVYEKHTRRRYYEALILHYAGVDAGKLEKIMGRA